MGKGDVDVFINLCSFVLEDKVFFIILVLGGINPQCVLQLDDPPQNFSTSVLNNTSTLAWDQPFIL